MAFFKRNRTAKNAPIADTFHSSESSTFREVENERRIQDPACAPCGPSLALEAGQGEKPSASAVSLIKGLSILDRFLALLVLIAMILGCVIGVYAPGVQAAFSGAEFAHTSVPLAVGMIVMMWPPLTKVQYEKLPAIFTTRKLWAQLIISLIVNWIIGPFVMLACAWAALPDLPTYRVGVIMVGLARCIAMVMIWNTLAGGDENLCAIIVIINSVLQIILYSPLAVFFINVISREEVIKIDYGIVAIAVLVFLGIPIGLGLITRFGILFTLGRNFLENKFLPWFGPVALIGLLYTIIIIFAQQARHILDNIGPVFRVVVPMFLYFMVMFSGAFGFMWWYSWRVYRKGSKSWGNGMGYREAAVQSFTASSNNFELSIAVCVAVFGANSDQALAATIGPLVEVPVLLALTWVSIWLGKRLSWPPVEIDAGGEQVSSLAKTHPSTRSDGEIERKSDLGDRESR